MSQRDRLLGVLRQGRNGAFVHEPGNLLTWLDGILAETQNGGDGTVDRELWAAADAARRKLRAFTEGREAAWAALQAALKAGRAQ